MRTTIDRAGRVVVPKAMRDALDLAAGGEIEIALDDGRIVISPAPVGKHLEGPPGNQVIVADGPIPTLTAEQVRQTLEEIRR